MLKYLVEEGGASLRLLSYDGMSGLHAAAQTGKLDTVKWLVSKIKYSKIRHLRSFFWAATWLLRPLFKVISLKILSFCILSPLCCRATCNLRRFSIVNFSGPSK